MFSVHDEEFVSDLPTAKDKHQVTNANMQGMGVGGIPQENTRNLENPLLILISTRWCFVIG